jgi:hypothetical protein
MVLESASRSPFSSFTKLFLGRNPSLQLSIQCAPQCTPKRPSSETHGAIRQQAIVKTSAKWSAYQIHSVIVLWHVEAELRNNETDVARQREVGRASVDTLDTLTILEVCFFAYDDVVCFLYEPTFRRNISPPYSGWQTLSPFDSQRGLSHGELLSRYEPRGLRISPPKRRFSQELHGVVRAHKIALFIGTAVKEANLRMLELIPGIPSAGSMATNNGRPQNGAFYWVRPNVYRTDTHGAPCSQNRSELFLETCLETWGQWVSPDG